MKKKILLVSCAVAIVCGALAFNAAESETINRGTIFDNVEALANGESGHECSASANCYTTKFINGEWVEVSGGSVSCNGKENCHSGDGYVECDGHNSSCG